MYFGGTKLIKGINDKNAKIKYFIRYIYKK